VPGADERLGIAPGESDRYPVPTALRYWHPQNWLTGGEANAFIIHHQLTQRLVIPIPDLWMMGIAILLGKGVALRLNPRSRRTQKQQKQYILGFTTATIFYGLVGLQLYISSAILLPWVLPVLIFWVYVLPSVRKPSCLD
jgi:hypothetical protein